MNTNNKPLVPDSGSSTWRVSAPHVRKAIAFVKRKGSVTADELVAWDLEHGQHLFDWDDASAARERRLYQARIFLNRFRGKFEGMRVRAFIHVHKDEEAKIHSSAYVGVEDIAQHPGMREQVIADIVSRMKSLASELKMWKLSPKERSFIFDKLATAMGVSQKKAA